MKKVLHCSLNGPTYSSAAIAEGFVKNGYDVTDFNWQHVRFNVGSEAMLSRLIGLANQGFDLIFLHIQNPEAFDWETAIELKKTGAFIVNFTEDVRKDISWHYDLAQFVDLAIFTNRDDVRKMNDDGIRNVAYLPTSYNHQWYFKYPSPQPLVGYGEIIFIGNNFVNTNLGFEKAQERYDMVQFLKQEFGSRFRYYGQNWGSETSVLNPQQCVAAYNMCEVSITQNNFYRDGYTSDRLFNSIGCGAFTISQHFPGIDDLFQNSVVNWRDFDELRQLIKMALDHSGRRALVAAQNHALILEHHKWANRIAELDGLIQQTKQDAKDFVQVPDKG